MYLKEIPAMSKTRDKAQRGQVRVASKMLLELFDNEDFSFHFHQVMHAVTEAEHLQVHCVIETTRNSNVHSGLAAVESPRNPHTPQIPSTTWRAKGELAKS